MMAFARMHFLLAQSALAAAAAASPSPPAPTAAAQDLSPWLIVAAVAAALLLVLLIFSPRARRPANGDGPAHDVRSSTNDSPHAAIEQDVRGLADELADMARRVGQQLDARSARLERLIREADDRLARLHAAAAAWGIVRFPTLQ